MYAAPKREDHPVITASQLAEADGILFGFLTRFGMMAAQMKAFFDTTGGLWQSGARAGKPAGVFFATGTQGSGQETTALKAVTQLTHHGMLFVPVGYTNGAGMFAMDEVKGSSPYGAGTFAGADGSRLPSDAELALAEHQGKYFAALPRSSRPEDSSPSAQYVVWIVCQLRITSTPSSGAKLSFLFSNYVEYCLLIIVLSF
ncbi:hypothetical protein ACQ4PT_067729 [Festuca glaucescens]